MLTLCVCLLPCTTACSPVPCATFCLFWCGVWWTTTDASLDLSTKLRLAEAEVAILQREVAELVADRNTLEAQAAQYKVHWVFAMQSCGRLVEERDEAVAKFEVGGSSIGWVLWVWHC